MKLNGYDRKIIEFNVLNSLNALFIRGLKKCKKFGIVQQTHILYYIRQKQRSDP